MNNKPTLLQHMADDLSERKITVIATNCKQNCILAKDQNGHALFIYARKDNFEKVFEQDYLGDVSAPYAKTFQYLLNKNKLKLIVTESASFFCQKMLPVDQYHRLKKMGSRINKTWRRRRINQKVKIESHFSTVDIQMGDNEEWFFQGHEADKLIDDARQSDLHHFCSPEAIIFHQAQGW